MYEYSVTPIWCSLTEAFRVPCVRGGVSRGHDFVILFLLRADLALLLCCLQKQVRCALENVRIKTPTHANGAGEKTPHVTHHTQNRKPLLGPTVT